MRVFVTGGSGFVGGHVIEHLVAAHHEVYALVRSEKSAAVVKGFGAVAVHGDLQTVDATMLRDCDAVIHAAAFVEEWGTRAQFEEGNVHGTQRVLDAAREAGVQRFIFVGTEAALFNGGDLNDVDETTPYADPQRFLYSETKAEAERRVLAANADGFTTLSVRPRLVWGPRDSSVLPVVLRMAKSGQWRWLDGGAQRTSTTHVHNLAHALLLSLTHGRGGEAYFVADDGTRTMREFLTAQCAAHGVTLPDASIGSWVARPLAMLVEATWLVLSLKGAPPMTRFAIFMMSSSVTVKTDKARRELGYAPVITVESGLHALRAG